VYHLGVPPTTLQFLSDLEVRGQGHEADAIKLTFSGAVHSLAEPRLKVRLRL
jgi:hypothetical protein